MKALVVGYGSIGRRHVNNLLTMPNIEVIVCTNRTDINLKNNRIKFYKSLDDSILEKPDFGVIANVTNRHIPIAIKLAQKNIDLFIEKPLSDSIIGINKLVNLVKKKHLVTMMGCNLRFNPGIQKVKEILAKKEVGRIISVRAECGSYLPDWHPYEDYRIGYAARTNMGGGVVLTVIHEIDYLYWMFGDVRGVFSISDRFSDLGIKAEDLSASIIRFKNNIIGELHLDYFQRPIARNCKIIGTRGTIEWNDETNSVRVFHTEKKKWEEKIRIKRYDNNEEYVKEMTHFIKSVKQRKNTTNDIFQGVKTLQIALAIKKSSKIKKMVLIK
jgi:predicted dehydrogenase